jgi:transposase-like protein
MAKEEKRQAAKSLYLTGEYTQDRIAAMLGINSATLTKWKASDNWEDERDMSQRLTTSSETYIRELIDFNLMVLQAKVRAQKAEFADGKIALKDMKLIDGKETDALSKLFIQIKPKELTVTITAGVVMKFLLFVESKSKEIAKTLTPYSDEFIQEFIKKQRL